MRPGDIEHLTTCPRFVTILMLYYISWLALLYRQGSLSLLSKGDVEWRSGMASYTLLFYFSIFCQPCLSVVCLNFLSFVASYT